MATTAVSCSQTLERSYMSILGRCNAIFGQVSGVLIFDKMCLDQTHDETSRFESVVI